MKQIKTPRGTFNIANEFTNSTEAKTNGFYYYFTNDDGTDIYTKHISEYSVKFAIIKKGA